MSILKYDYKTFISKYFYLIIFVLCFLLTLRVHLSREITPELPFSVVIIYMIIYIGVLLLAPVLKLFLKPYENCENILISKVFLIICTPVILWNWYNSVFVITLCLLYGILLRKNTLLSLFAALLICIPGYLFAFDFAFLIAICGIVVLFPDFKIRPFVFLIITTVALGIYSLLTCELDLGLNSECALLAILFSYYTFVINISSQGKKKTFLSIVATFWGIFIIFIDLALPSTLPQRWYIIPMIMISHASRSLTSYPSIEEVVDRHRRSFSSIFLIYLLPIALVAFSYYATFDQKTIFERSASYPLLHYYFSWTDLGFVQRGLIGEIIERIFGFSIPINTMILIGFSIHIISILLMIALGILIVRSTPNNCISSKLFMFILIGSVLIPDLYTMVFRSDLQLVLIAMLCVILSAKNRSFVWAIPFLSIIAMLIHPVYAFLIFSPVFICMFYRAFIHPENHKLRNAFILITTTLTVIALFFFFSFFSYRFAKLSVYDGVNLINMRAGGWPENDTWFKYNPETGISPIFSYVLYASPSEHTSLTWPAEYVANLRHQTFLRMFSILPLIFYYFYVYFMDSKHYKERYKRILCRLIPFTILVMLPLYILELDYGRWNLHLILSVIIAMQIPHMMKRTHSDSDIGVNTQSKEKTYAVLAFIISELAYLITWSS